MRTRLIIASLIVFLVIAGLVVVRFVQSAPSSGLPEAVTNEPQGQYVITETPNGFTPATLTVRVGETVTFKSTTGKPHWPASNLHPSHLLYAEFDPQMPVPPKETWNFTFTKPGTWQYHDHLAPYFTGTIIVEPGT